MSIFKNSRNTRYFFIAAAAVALLALGFLGSRLFAQKTQVALYVFDTCGGCNVQNPCKPCALFIEQINIYSRMLAENKLRGKTELKPYNIYMNHDAEVYRAHMTALGIEEAPSLPALVVGNNLIAGEFDLTESVVSAVKAERRFIPLVQQLCGLNKKEKTTMGTYDEKTIVNFSLAWCEDCKKTDAFLDTVNGVKIVKVDPSDAAGRTLYEKYCEMYGVPVEDYAVPRLFLQKSSFLGYSETERSLEKTLAGNFKTIKIALD